MPPSKRKQEEIAKAKKYFEDLQAVKKQTAAARKATVAVAPAAPLRPKERTTKPRSNVSHRNDASPPRSVDSSRRRQSDSVASSTPPRSSRHSQQRSEEPKAASRRYENDEDDMDDDDDFEELHESEHGNDVDMDEKEETEDVKPRKRQRVTSPEIRAPKVANVPVAPVVSQPPRLERMDHGSKNVSQTSAALVAPTSSLRRRTSRPQGDVSYQRTTRTTPPRSSGIIGNPVAAKLPFGSPVPVPPDYHTTTEHIPLPTSSSTRRPSLALSKDRRSVSSSHQLQSQREFSTGSPSELLHQNETQETQRPAVAGGVLAVACAGIVLVVSLSILLTIGISSGFLDSVATSLVNVSSALGSALHPTLIQGQMPCFADYPFAEDVEDEDSRSNRPPHCQNHVEHVLCPKHGLCSQSRLMSCSNEHFEVSSSGLACIWTERSLGLLERLRQTIVQISIESMCSSKPTGEHFFVKHDTSGRPLFSYGPLAESLNIKYDASFVRTFNVDSDVGVFLMGESEDGSTLIGLHPSQDLDLPISCKVSNWLVGMIQGFFGLIMTIGNVLFSSLWFCARHNPITTVLGVLAAYVIYIYCNKIRAKARTELEFYNLRDRVFQELSHSQHAIPADIIRDRFIIRDHLSPKERDRIKYVLFPMVARFIGQSPSVRTFRTNDNGTDVVMWQWLDPEPFAPAQSKDGKFVHFMP